MRDLIVDETFLGEFIPEGILNQNMHDRIMVGAIILKFKLIIFYWLHFKLFKKHLTKQQYS